VLGLRDFKRLTQAMMSLGEPTKSWLLFTTDDEHEKLILKEKLLAQFSRGERAQADV